MRDVEREITIWERQYRRGICGHAERVSNEAELDYWTKINREWMQHFIEHHSVKYTAPQRAVLSELLLKAFDEVRILIARRIYAL